MEITIDIALKLLGWSAVINLGFLAFWFLAFIVFRDGIFRIHTRWFNLSPTEFDKVHYLGMLRFKLMVLLLNVTPYIALRTLI